MVYGLILLGRCVNETVSEDGHTLSLLCVCVCRALMVPMGLLETAPAIE